MNNLSEKLKEKVKKDTMIYLYGGKETIFSKTFSEQSNRKEKSICITKGYKNAKSKI